MRKTMIAIAAAAALGTASLVTGAAAAPRGGVAHFGGGGARFGGGAHFAAAPRFGGRFAFRGRGFRGRPGIGLYAYGGSYCNRIYAYPYYDYCSYGYGPNCCWGW